LTTGYTYLTTPDNAGYNDSSHAGAGTPGELTDGVSAGIAWALPQIQTISLADVAYLVGWGNRDPGISFSFGTPQTVGAVTVWIADSNNSAGVGIPKKITIRTPDSTFLQTFSIIDPPGSGATVPITLTGFSVVTSDLIVEAERNFFWTMFSEVQFDSVPEPSIVALFIPCLAFVGLRRRR
jgi:hypothetical protein